MKKIMWTLRLTVLILIGSLTACGDATVFGVRLGGAETTPPADVSQETPDSSFIGIVIDLEGRPIEGALVAAGGEETATDSAGSFELPAGTESAWVTVTHADFLSRTRAAAVGNPVLFRLTPDDGETISISFVGDTMFGRRFYDRDEDGDLSDGLLPPGAGLAEHLALLDHVRPLLENADITAANLESPLDPDPYVDPTRPRPDRFHATKDYVFASHPAAAAALFEAGVDVVDIANNHMFDLLEAGISSTHEALEQAGFAAGSGYFGAGFSLEQAWAPAYIEAKGQITAFIGCTSITGYDHETSYVISSSDDKAGAAACSEGSMRSMVSEARKQADLVVVMIHGGDEYKRVPSSYLQQMTAVAREAGAALVINHTPHVVGGFDWDGSTLTAWSMGNFLFDQDVWPTFETYLLTAHVRQGEVVRAYAEPLMIESYQPRGVTGGLAAFVARGAAGRQPGPFVVENGAVELDVSGRSEQYIRVVSVDGNGEEGTLAAVHPDWWVTSPAAAGQLRVGRDLLWTGAFEDEDVDQDSGEAPLWQLSGDDKSVGAAYAYEGRGGVRLERGASNSADVVLTPLHRVLIDAGSELTLAGTVRAAEGAVVSLQLSWYPDTRGSSSEKTIVALDLDAPDQWQPFRLDVSAPEDAVAVGVFLRLSPPAAGLVHADFDNIRLIEWAEPDALPSWQFDHVLVFGEQEIELRSDRLPAGPAEDLADQALLIPLD